MTQPTPFPARTVISSYLSCEEALGSVLRIVPWCKQHESVWSPTLTTVIMEACTQLDSLWGYTAWLSSCVQQAKDRNELTIKEYFEYFGNVSSTPLGDRWAVFWGGDPVQIRPFAPWSGATTYQTLEWWRAYNKLKHDRLANQEKATLAAAVNATAGLFLAILANEHCRYAAEAAGWLSAGGGASHNPKAWLAEDSSSVKQMYILAETALFSYPVGWCNEEIKQNDDWLGNCKFRFKHWFSEFATRA